MYLRLDKKDNICAGILNVNQKQDLRKLNLKNTRRRRYTF